jgi:hypothetical protein
MSPALLEYIARAYRQLLDDAKRALEKDSIAISIVFSHAALDVCIEWVISNLLRLRNVEDLTEPILDMSTSVYARLKLCGALSGNKIKPGEAFEKHRERRNAVVHGGKLCSKAEAKESLEFLERLINKLEKVLGDKQGGK